MKAMTKGGIIGLAAAVVFGTLCLEANASLIDLGEIDVTTWVAGVPSAQAFIEKNQGLSRGSLTYLNSFQADTGTLADNGTVDGSHFGVTMTDGGVNGNVTWDLGTSGFQLSYVFVKDARDLTNPSLSHLYAVTSDDVFHSNGEQFVTLNGISNIIYISFFGVAGNPVPDGGPTLILLGLGLGTIEFLRRFRLRHCDTIKEQ